MVQNAGLMFGDASSSFILAYMLTMARQKDGRVSIQQTSDSGVQHNRQGAANGLMCQTNCFRRPALTPALPAECRLDAAAAWSARENWRRTLWIPRLELNSVSQ